MRKPSRRRLAGTIVAMLREQPQQHQHIVSMTAAYLIARKRQKECDLLLLDIARQLGVDSGHLYAMVASARRLDDSARANLKRYLKVATGASTIELQERIDHNLLAGIIVRTADQELDTSARSKLIRLSGLNVEVPEKV